MATYYSSYSNEYRLRLDITQGTQNVANNTSVVSWTLYLLSGNKSMSVYSTYHATVNGVASPSTTQTNVTIGYNSSVTLGSGSTTVTHNADGTKSVAFSASFKANSPVYSGGELVSPGTMTISGNFALTTIPRYAAITAFTASVNDLSATLNWTADKTISEWRWSSNSGSSYSAWSTVNSNSGSTSVSVSPGSTYGFRIQVKNSASGLITTSSVVSKTATKTLSTLSLSTTSQNVGSDITWTINESYDYTHRIAYFFGSTSGWILGSGSTESNTSTGTWTVPTALANQIPNATSGSGTIEIHTYYGSVRLGTKSYTFTAKVPNNTTWQPTVPSVSISDAVSQPTGITSYVQGKSKAKVVSSSTAQGGASISSYKVTVGGIGNYYGSTITSGYLTASGTVTITVRATDSRGYYRESVNTITVAGYSPPRLTTYTASRSPNDQGTDLATSINFSISSVNSQNTKQYRIRYRPTGGTWVTLVDSTDYYTRSTTHSATDVLDVNNSYEVEFYIKDSYTSVTQTRNIGTGFVLMDFNATGKGMAIGKVSESNSFEVALPTFFQDNVTYQASNLIEGGIRIHGSVSATLSSPGWYRVARFSATGNDRMFAAGGVIDMEITRTYSVTDNEAHKVTLIGSYQRVNFFNQKTVGNQFIRGIRWNYYTDFCALDIYYSGTTSNLVRFSITSVNTPQISFTRYETFTNVTGDATIYGSIDNLVGSASPSNANERYEQTTLAIKLIAPTLSDEVLTQIPLLVDEWAVGVDYVADKSVVRFEDALYRVITSHRSQADWPPPDVPALYKQIEPPNTIGAWVQPLGEHDAYQVGDKVTHKDKTWESTADNNVWEPGVYGWEITT